jgi:ribosome-associated toxin RatA of RatAB toxin-antitoxin module
MLSTAALLLLAQIDMSAHLSRGPMVLIEEAKGGKFGQVTAVALIDAPPPKVFEVLTDYGNYKNFVPKVTTSEVKKRTPKEVEARFVLDVPGPDTDYTVKYTLDAEALTITGAWAGGDLKGSRWSWKLEALPEGKTLMTASASVQNFSALAQSIEDDAQTVTVGINVTSILTATKAIKRHAEELQRDPPKPMAAPAAAARSN